MTRSTIARDEPPHILFVAREPDETLRTFLPVIDVLAERFGLRSRVLFHHQPGGWAREALRSRGVTFDEISLPEGVVPGRFARVKGAPSVDEVARFWQARALAASLLACHRPSALVVVQDTLLLERFLVRRANAQGIPTLVVQWAFSYPQAMYDRIRTFQFGRSGRLAQASRPRRLLRPVTRGAYQAVLRLLGLKFNLVSSYGGGEARQFAVMGEAFREQFVSQGVRGKAIVPTGHPTHDVVFRQAQRIDARQRSEIRARYGFGADRTIVLYATQPVLWRKVVTRETLEQNVRAIADAVRRDPTRQLVLKLHPREDPADYAFCERLNPAVMVIPTAEMPELIAACDLFVSSSSSTVLLAMMLDRPIITVNFDHVPHFDQYESIGGTLHVRTHAAFAEALDRALDDPDARAALAAQQRSVLERYTRFDGHAADRIAALLAESVGARRPAPIVAASS
jgi:glycosyltransferase involved in cell wall biosynthesis